MDFTGKAAISTGATSGMGLLFAQNFADLGGNVVMCDVNEEVLAVKVAEIIRSNSHGILFLKVSNTPVFIYGLSFGTIAAIFSISSVFSS